MKDVNTKKVRVIVERYAVGVPENHEFNPVAAAIKRLIKPDHTAVATEDGFYAFFQGRISDDNMPIYCNKLPSGVGDAIKSFNFGSDMQFLNFEIDIPTDIIR